MLFVSILPDKIPVDNGKIIGGNISVLACHVTHLLEYSRHYGTNSEEKRVGGVITSLERCLINTDRSSKIHSW